MKVLIPFLLLITPLAFAQETSLICSGKIKTTVPRLDSDEDFGIKTRVALMEREVRLDQAKKKVWLRGSDCTKTNTLVDGWAEAIATDFEGDSISAVFRASRDPHAACRKKSGKHRIEIDKSSGRLKVGSIFLSCALNKAASS
jgi:hypothetical protein|tara:strand:- start:1864 stop:2292 length:429 start_codon:yes stop_codon:yes gene_type:complete